MESFLNRYRNITLLLLVIFGQLVLLAVQVKNDQDVRFIRVWTVTAVTPFAHLVEGLRGGSVGFLHNYILLHDTNAENRRLQQEVGKLKLENTFLKNELATADRAKALQIFESQTLSKTLAANVILTGAGTNSKVVFVNRGSVSGVQRGMAVVTPDGIVGKVIAAYPTASQVLLITGADFAAGVISQRNQVRGTLKGQGTPLCSLDYVSPSEKVEPGDWFYTSGDDRIFPRGFRAGVVKSVKPGSPFQEISIEPVGVQHGAEDVLILLEGVHQQIPEAPPANQPVYIAPPPPAPETPAGTQPAAQPTGIPNGPGTEADRLRTQYKALGDAQGHTFGKGEVGSKPPDFNMKLPAAGGSVAPAPVKPPPVAAPATPASPPKQAPAVPKTSDPTRRSNQAAGVSPGGLPPR